MAETPTAPKTRANGVKPRAVVASAARVNLGLEVGRGKPKAVAGWQQSAWQANDEVGEVSQSTSYLGKGVGRMRLYPGIQNPDDAGKPEPDTEALSEETLMRLDTGIGGIEEIQQSLGINLSVAGEAYLLGLRSREEVPGDKWRPDEETWSVKSTSELKRTAEGYVLYDDPEESSAGRGGNRLAVSNEEGTDGDFVLRIWRPDPQWSKRAWSALKPLRAVVDELLIYERWLRSIGRSRIAMNGVWKVPNGLSFGSVEQTGDDGAQQAQMDPFMREMLAAGTAALQNEGSAGAAFPMVVRGDKDELSAMSFEKYERPVDPEIIRRMDFLITRLGNGLDVPPEVVTGLGQSSHWNAWAIDEDAFQAYIEPLTIAIVNALVAGYYRPSLVLGGMSEEEAAKRVIGYDPVNLVTHPNRAADSDKGYELFAISGKAWRRHHGFPESDQPDDEELMKRVAIGAGRGIGPDVAAELLKQSGIAPDLEPPDPLQGKTPAAPGQPVGELPAQGGPPTAEQVAPGPPATGPSGQESQRPGTTAAATPQRPSKGLGYKLAAIDRDLRTRLQVAASRKLQEVLRRTGARLVSKVKDHAAIQPAIATTPRELVASVLGPSVVRSLLASGEIPEDEWDDLLDEFDTETEDGQNRGTALLAGHYGLDDHQTAALDHTNATNRRAATAWLATALGAYALDKLYSGADEPVTQGEASRLGIPMGLIREALARAGGADNGTPDNPGMGGAVASSTVNDLLSSLGQEPSGYEWVYGAGARIHPFEDHEFLDGETFASWTDDVLAVGPDGDWIDTDFYFPGDHFGCQCDAISLMEDGSSDDSAAPEDAVAASAHTAEDGDPGVTVIAPEATEEHA